MYHLQAVSPTPKCCTTQPNCVAQTQSTMSQRERSNRLCQCRGGHSAQTNGGFNMDWNFSCHDATKETKSFHVVQVGVGRSGPQERQAISGQTCLCLREAGVFSFARAKTFRDGQKGMDQSGSPELVAIDPGPKATVREVAAAVGSRCKAGNVDEVPTNQPRWRTMEEASTSAGFSHSNKQGPQSRSSVDRCWVQRNRRFEQCSRFLCNVPRRKRRSPMWNSDLLVHLVRVDAVRNALEKARVCGTREASGRADFGMQGLCRTNRETAAQVGSRKSCRKRFIGARASTSCPVGGRSNPPPTAVAELEAEVSRLRSELAATRTAPPADQPGDQPAKKPQLREDFVPTQSRRRGCG